MLRFALIYVEIACSTLVNLFLGILYVEHRHTVDIVSFMSVLLPQVLARNPLDKDFICRIHENTSKDNNC
jgi:hypothetical protein